MSKQLKNALLAIFYCFIMFQCMLVMVEGLVRQIEIEDELAK
jgi:hypothetical protein